MAESVNPTQCPFCNSTNQCMAQSTEACWCFSSSIPKALIDLVPAEKQRQACICQACVNQFNQNPAAFKAKL